MEKHHNINRYAFNTPSPVTFPSASPTPKLQSTPSKKIPETQLWQHNIEVFPPNIMFTNTREKSAMLIEDTDSISDHFNEADYLSSIISSDMYCPNYQEPFSVYSLKETPSLIKSEPIVGSIYSDDKIMDPISERLGVFSLQEGVETNVSEKSHYVHSSGKWNTILSKMKKVVSGKRLD